MAPVDLRVERRIDADPTSTALLLAGPTAVDLWPGAVRTGEVSGLLRVESADASAPPVLVQAGVPVRTATAFVTEFAFWPEDAPVGAVARGRLSLRYEGSIGRARATLAVLELFDPPPVDLTAAAHAFLDTLAELAEERSSAA